MQETGFKKECIDPIGTYWYTGIGSSVFVFEGMAYGIVEAASSGIFGSMAFPFQDQNGGPGEKQTRLSTTSFPLTQYMM